MALDPNSSSSSSAAAARTPTPAPAPAARPGHPVANVRVPAVSFGPDWVPPMMYNPEQYKISYLIRKQADQQKQQQQQQRNHSNPPHASLKDLPSSNAQPKVASSSSVAAVPESNGHKDTREKVRDDALVVIRNRKVRITEGSSLYALCRSWLRNGVHEEIQPQHGSTVRSLPKPSPVPVATGSLQTKEGEEDEDEDEELEEEQGSDDAEVEGGESVENLSTDDLFKRHVKRAKKVRARLREERLKRIARYKSRLALLLPPLVEHFRNDA